MCSPGPTTVCKQALLHPRAPEPSNKNGRVCAPPGRQATQKRALPRPRPPGRGPARARGAPAAELPSAAAADGPLGTRRTAAPRGPAAPWIHKDSGPRGPGTANPHGLGASKSKAPTHPQGFGASRSKHSTNSRGLWTSRSTTVRDAGFLGFRFRNPMHAHMCWTSSSRHPMKQ